jgi:hypothetical protein
MTNKFYYSHSSIYGWCIYDRDTGSPAYDACYELLPPESHDESGTICVSPVLMASEYKAMELCRKLNHAYRNQQKVGAR